MWLYIPESLPPSAFAPEAEGLTLASGLRFRRFVRSCTWRGKPSPPRTWWRRLKRVSWLRRLYGQTPEPSQADAFVDAWTSYWRGSRASRTASPARCADPPTTAISGRPPAGSSFRPALGSCSSRTSAECFPAAAPIAFSEGFAGWVSRLREECSQRQRLAPRTYASGFSYSAWPTPTERDHRSTRASAETYERNRRPLSEAAGLWATPTVADTEGGRLSRSGARKDELLLRGQAKALHSRQAPAPISSGATSSGSAPSLNPLFVEHLMGWPLGWTALLIGPASPWRGVLTASGSLEMGLYRWRRLMRSELLRLPSPPALPAQLDLFG